MYNRRLFLSMSGGALAAAALPGKLFASGPAANAITPQSLAHYAQGTMTQELFEGVKGSVFTAFLRDGVGYLRLADVQPFGADDSATAIAATAVRSQAKRTVVTASSVAAAPRVQGFTLQFSITGNLTEQGTYLLDHGRLGRLALFLVPGQASATATIVTQQAAISLPSTPVARPVRGIAAPVSTGRAPTSFQ